MQVSNFVLFGVAQAYILLIGVCVFLLMHTRTLKKMVRRLQERVRQLVQDVRQEKAANAQAQAKLASSNTSYEKQVNNQLLLTRKYHNSLNADRDIVLDLNPETPLPRQIAAFRHAVLLAEKEAFRSGENETPDWQTLENKLSQLIRFYQSENTDNNTRNHEEALAKQAKEAEVREAQQQAQLDELQQELENSKKRVANLEKFKKLFFDMEKKWKEAQEQAQHYHEQLSALAPQVDDQESYENLLQRYHAVYNDVGELLHSGKSAGGDTIIVEQSNKKPQVSTIEITHTDKRTANELKHLRKVAEEQHRLIHILQQKLSKANTIEEKNEIIEDLSHQLERQTRFVKESETCIKLLEDELSTSMNKVSQLEAQLNNAEKDLEHIPKMKIMIKQFTEESKDMLQGLAALEKENEELMKQSEKTGSRNPAAVEQMKQELLTLQAQYAELEERYLEMKMQS